MPTPHLITSPANPRLKALAALRRRRTREQERRTLVEGYDELGLALEAGVVPQTLFYCPELMGGAARADDLVARVGALGGELVRLSRPAFEKAAYREGPDGVLAVVPTVDRRCEDLTAGLPDAPLVLVCQAVEKPGNLGAMLRTADAAGVDAVVAADPVTDWGNPNTVRASKGTVFSVPVASDPTAVTLAWLRERGIPLVAATPDTEVTHTEVDYRGPVAIVVGTEKTGLTAEVLTAAQHRVRIPMVGLANSLNVATSAAVIVYEAVRQRAADPRP
ncbi:TrmH family RNA methyltransferase [Ornithinimicrobium flavum]|uniref:TrmH family RNA methyltransferase n=1 Tax=Ornithinimicrobium flavum TaxID=1288636 RepID=UPI00107026F3|nr:RNA methyltransferase [Ornithinimicrobium flavum]